MYSRKNISIAIAILFHVSGAIGILFSPYKEWFIANTPLNLLLMFGLLIWNQKDRNIHFWLFTLLAFLTGMGTEMIGVHTGRLFGNYAYGTSMGPRFNEVPLLIGVNWMVVVFGCGILMTTINEWIMDKYREKDIRIRTGLHSFSIIVDGALLATFFDWIMEPGAIMLGFWEWKGTGEVPFFNYLCWFLISAALLVAFHKLKFEKNNQFAVHLLLIQTFFFIALRVFA